VQNQSRTDGIVPGIEGHARTVITDPKALDYAIPGNDQKPQAILGRLLLAGLGQ
jgi:hypothetical protein